MKSRALQEALYTSSAHVLELESFAALSRETDGGKGGGVLEERREKGPGQTLGLLDFDI